MTTRMKIWTKVLRKDGLSNDGNLSSLKPTTPRLMTTNSLLWVLTYSMFHKVLANPVGPSAIYTVEGRYAVFSNCLWRWNFFPSQWDDVKDWLVMLQNRFENRESNRNRRSNRKIFILGWFSSIIPLCIWRNTAPKISTKFLLALLIFSLETTWLHCPSLLHCTCLNL